MGSRCNDALIATVDPFIASSAGFELLSLVDSLSKEMYFRLSALHREQLPAKNKHDARVVGDELVVVVDMYGAGKLCERLTQTVARKIAPLPSES